MSRDELAAIENYLRKRSNAELIQFVTDPTLLLTVPELALEDLDAFDYRPRVIIDLAKEELSRRTAGRVLRVSWVSLGVAMVSALAAVAAAVTAVFTYLAHR